MEVLTQYFENVTHYFEEINNFAGLFFFLPPITVAEMGFHNDWILS